MIEATPSLRSPSLSFSFIAAYPSAVVKGRTPPVSSVSPRWTTANSKEVASRVINEVMVIDPMAIRARPARKLSKSSWRTR